METRDFIGKSFWSFFNELPTFKRNKKLLEREENKATLLVTNEETNEQYKLVCACEVHAIMTYGLCSSSYLDFGDIYSLTKV